MFTVLLADLIMGFIHSESIEQLALKEVCVTVHLLLTAARHTPAVRASRRTVRASWLVSQ